MSTFSDGEKRRKSGVKHLSRIIDTREINACKINRYKMYIFKIIIVTELNSTSTTVSATSLDSSRISRERLRDEPEAKGIKDEMDIPIILSLFQERRKKGHL